MKNRPAADHHAEDGVDAELREEIAAEPLRRRRPSRRSCGADRPSRTSGSSGRADPPSACRMKIATMKTISRSFERRRGRAPGSCAPIRSALGSGCCTSTGIGSAAVPCRARCWPGRRRRPPGRCSPARSAGPAGSTRPRRVGDVAPDRLRPSARSWSHIAACRRRGSRPASPITLPSATKMPSAKTTASSTAGTCGTCELRRSSSTTGASTKESSTASVIGISTSRAR